MLVFLFIETLPCELSVTLPLSCGCAKRGMHTCKRQKLFCVFGCASLFEKHFWCLLFPTTGSLLCLSRQAQKGSPTFRKLLLHTAFETRNKCESNTCLSACPGELLRLKEPVYSRTCSIPDDGCGESRRRAQLTCPSSSMAPSHADCRGKAVPIGRAIASTCLRRAITWRRSEKRFDSPRGNNRLVKDYRETRSACNVVFEPSRFRRYTSKT